MLSSLVPADAGHDHTPPDLVPLEPSEHAMVLHSEEAIENHGNLDRWIPYSFAGLAILIGLVAGVGLLVAVVLLVLSPERTSGLEMVALTGLGVTGLAAGGGMLGLIILYRQTVRLSEQLTTLDQQTAILAEQSLARTQADTYAGQARVDPAELRDLLARIHETLLLPEPERARRFRMIVEREFTKRLLTTQAFIDSHDFHRARQELAGLVERFGADPRIQQAQQKLEAAAEAARANDITRASKHIEDLMGTTRWDEAEQQAHELGEKYPLAGEAATLIERVRRERKLFELKHRQRMHDEIQESVNERRWQEALVAVRQFVQTFPTGPDTDLLRQRIATLEANAEIQARQTLERYIKQYIRDKQYWDALALARRIISEFPLSPQANALRGQIPRLEELARKQGP